VSDSENDWGVLVATLLLVLAFVIGMSVGECSVKDLDDYGDPGKPCYPNGTCYRSTCIDVKDGETVCVESK
jgi:hypothetical protein